MSDLEYFRKREEHARQAAQQAPNDEIRKLHLELAARYASLAGADIGSGAEEDQRRTG